MRCLPSLVLAVPLALSGCSLNPLADDATVAFDYEVASFDTSDPPPVQLAVASAIRIHAPFLRSCGTTELDARVSRSGRRVTLTVERLPRTEATCRAAVAPVLYDATISGLSNGSYELRIVHIREDVAPSPTTGSTREVLRDSVFVGAIP